MKAPIDYLSADHFRQKILCKFLDEIAFDPAGPGAARLARLVQGYLERDLRHHVADEEEDLFPRLRARCGADDNIEQALRRLSDEHDQDEGLWSTVLGAVRAVAKGQDTSEERSTVQAMALFAETQRRHLAWEDEVVLPLARARLTADDLEAMGRRMAQRRGVAYPD